MFSFIFQTGYKAVENTPSPRSEARSLQRKKYGEILLLSLSIRLSSPKCIVDVPLLVGRGGTGTAVWLLTHNVPGNMGCS